MENETVIIMFHHVGRRITDDLEVPLDISAKELINALNTAYDLGIDMTDAKSCYLKAEKPIAFLKGNKTLREYGLRNGSIIHYTE